LVFNVTAAIVCTPAGSTCGWDEAFTNAHCWEVADAEEQFHVPETVLSEPGLIDSIFSIDVPAGTERLNLGDEFESLADVPAFATRTRR